MNDLTANNEISELVTRVIESRTLGRSPIYAKLLTYFAEQAVSGNACSEYSVAIDVFDKEQDYDVTADSTVRVYIYNLRKKLESYYADLGKNDARQLSIPKGEYRLLVRDIDLDKVATRPDADLDSSQNSSAPNLLKYALLVLAAIVATALITASLINKPTQTPVFSEQQMAFWGGILTDKKPIMIVIGDYFIFAESGDSSDDYDGDIRLVREFDVNSAEDLRRKNLVIQQSDAPNSNKRFDLGLTYLPRGSAYALARVQQLLQKANKIPRISMMSELSAEDIRANHIIYIGYLSGMGVLEGYAFANSRFEIGLTYDVLIDTATNIQYRSDFIEAQEDRNFTDFGTISSFSLAANNQIVTLTGTRDAGLMEMSDIAITTDLLDQMQLADGNGLAYEALFEVDGFNLTNISSRLIVSGNMPP